MVVVMMLVMIDVGGVTWFWKKQYCYRRKPMKFAARHRKLWPTNDALPIYYSSWHLPRQMPSH